VDESGPSPFPLLVAFLPLAPLVVDPFFPSQSRLVGPPSMGRASRHIFRACRAGPSLLVRLPCWPTLQFSSRHVCPLAGSIPDDQGSRFVLHGGVRTLHGPTSFSRRSSSSRPFDGSEVCFFFFFFFFFFSPMSSAGGGYYVLLLSP